MTGADLCTISKRVFLPHQDRPLHHQQTGLLPHQFSPSSPIGSPQCGVDRESPVLVDASSFDSDPSVTRLPRGNLSPVRLSTWFRTSWVQGATPVGLPSLPDSPTKSVTSGAGTGRSSRVGRALLRGFLPQSSRVVGSSRGVEVPPAVPEAL